MISVTNISLQVEFVLSQRFKITSKKRSLLILLFWAIFSTWPSQSFNKHKESSYLLVCPFQKEFSSPSSGANAAASCAARSKSTPEAAPTTKELQRTWRRTVMQCDVIPDGQDFTLQKWSFSLSCVHCQLFTISNHLNLHRQKSFVHLVAVHFLNFVSLQVEAAKRPALSNIDLLIVSCHIWSPCEKSFSLCYLPWFLSLSVFQHSYIWAIFKLCCYELLQSSSTLAWIWTSTVSFSSPM